MYHLDLIFLSFEIPDEHSLKILAQFRMETADCFMATIINHDLILLNWDLCPFGYPHSIPFLPRAACQCLDAKAWIELKFLKQNGIME